MAYVEPRADTGSKSPSPPERPGFGSTAAHFEWLANKARDDDQRQRWLEAADFYRSLARIIPAMPAHYKHNGGVPPLTRAERWRARAELCRTLADCVTEPTCRHQLIDLAAGYESMAIAAE